MQINLVEINKNEYTIIENKHDIGIIKIYSNSFHGKNCYLQLVLKSYDLNIAEEIFKKLLEEKKRPLQVMVSSDEYELISFIEKGGFICKRKCYEIEVTKNDYIQRSFDKVNIRRCEKDSIEYKWCCELMYEYYKNTHERINPLTANFDEFTETLPEEVIYQNKDGNIVNAAFIEDEEIAYVSSSDKEGFRDFISTAVEEMLETRESLCFECDDCDWAAMELCSLFEVELGTPYNTYIRDMKLLDIQPSQFYLSEEKIRKIKEWFDPNDLSNFEPIPIKELNGKIIFTDGHTRAWVAYEAGLTEVPYVWDEDDLDWDLYQKCVDACLERGVNTVADFEKRILSPEDYIEKWDYWCDEMQAKNMYLDNPCKTLSIPYWKNKTITLPENMNIVHDDDFVGKDYDGYSDQQYFRLIHRLENLDSFTHEKYYVKTATQDDIPTFVDLINQSYTGIAVTTEQLLGYTRLMVYDADLWILVYEKETSTPVGCGIAEFDREIKEGVLEWIQVLPSYRGQKIGRLMVNELLNRLTNKAEFVTVSGRVDNETKPEKLYRSCGFTGNDIWHVLTKANS